MASDSKTRPVRSLSPAIFALAFSAFLWPALFTFDAGDWPSPNQYPHNSPSANACGIAGAWLAYQLFFYLGAGVYPLMVLVTLGVARRLVRGPIDHFWERVFGTVLLVVCVSASAHLLSRPGASSLPVARGGLIGYGLGEFLRHNLDQLGAGIVLASSLIVGLMFATEGWLLKVPAIVRRIGTAVNGAVGLGRRVVGATLTAVPATGDGGVSADESRALLERSRSASLSRNKRRKRAVEAKASGQARLFDEDEVIDSEAADEGMDEGASEVDVAPNVEAGDRETEEVDEAQGSGAAGKGGGRKGAKKVAGPIVRFPSPNPASTKPYPQKIENWRLPALDLLHEPEYGFTRQQEQFVRKQAQILEQTLREFRLDARVVEIDTGPVITMFELKLGAGIKVSQIANLSNDMARALRAHAIRVVAPISGKNTVGIEVPNAVKERVRLHELMTAAGQKASDMRLPLFLGKDAGGAPMVTDLTSMPHMLIAGTTGSGKSVCLNALIMSLLMTQRPDHVKLILIDPKMVEMNQFKGVPHLMCPIVTDLVQAEKILEWAVSQMDERYEMLAEARVKNVAAYNSLGPEGLYERLEPDSDAEKDRIATHLPYIVIVIDELADLMMTAAKEVEHHLSRLAQKSRAVGIHIIVATQRPEAKVVTGLIKSNLPSRICFRVASRMDSRIVLDQNGGEVLLGQGDMLVLPPGSHKLARAQGTFLDDAEIHAVLDDLASRSKPEFHPGLVRLRSNPSAGADLTCDPLFDDAVRVILQSKRGSVSLLQRRLTIGYSRASRLIDQVATAGIVGDHKGSQAREVLMTLEQWEALRSAADEEDADR